MICHVFCLLVSWAQVWAWDGFYSGELFSRLVFLPVVAGLTHRGFTARPAGGGNNPQLGSRGATLLPWSCCRGAGEQGSRGAGEQGSRGAGEQGSREAGEQGSPKGAIK